VAEDNKTSEDTATYIPSSAFVAKNSTMSEEQRREYDLLMANADKALKRAEKYI